MDAAPLDRPLRNRTLLALAGVVHADPDAVFALLRERIEADALAGATILRRVAALSVDAPTRSVIAQDARWGRAEWRVLEHGDGARVEHEIVDIARVPSPLSALAARSALRAAPERFRGLLDALVAAAE